MIAMKRLSRGRDRLLRRPRRMARQGRRLCAAGLWRSLCPPHRRQLFQRRRPAAGRNAAAAEERGLSTLPEWLVERGIGETRAALVEDGEIVEARDPPRRRDHPPAPSSTRSCVAVAPQRTVEAGGEQYLLPRGRAGHQRGKPPADRGHPRSAGRRGAVEARRLPAAPRKIRALPRRWPSGTPGQRSSGWDDLVEEARSGIVGFAGGELRIRTDRGDDADRRRRLAGARRAGADAGAWAAARAIRRLDIGGSIGIDLPTLKGREAAAAGRFDPCRISALAVRADGGQRLRLRPDRPASRRRASLIELAADRAGVRGPRPSPPGRRARSARSAWPRTLPWSRVLEGQPGWLDRLARQVGGAVTLRSDPSLAMSAGHAERA